jgi:lycopene cyclase domain-containing protein
LLIPFSLAVGLISYDKSYTASTFILLGLALIYVSWIAKCSWLPRFYESYAISLIPFFLKNGILTGSFLETQVVWYNNNENLGIRLGTIPFEDIFYGMLLILGTLYFYEKFEANRKGRLE